MSRRVLIVDDHEVFRAQVRRLVETLGWTVAGEEGDGVTALRAAERLQPDVILLDVQLPDFNGFDVADELAATQRARIVMVSARDAGHYRHRLRRPGVPPFVCKQDLSGSVLGPLLEGP